MTKLIKHCPRPILLLAAFSFFGKVALAASLPGDGQAFRIEIPGGESSLWLGAKPVQGEASLTKTAASATVWRFHQHEDKSFSIESLEDGKRWLALDSKGSIRLAPNDAAMSSRWSIKLHGEQILIENLAEESANRFLLLSSSSVTAASKVEAEKSPFVLHEQAASPLPFAHGDVISIRSMAAAEGRLWLDGNTTNGIVGLATEAEMLANSGTQWRVQDNADGSFSFQTLGNIAGRRWLDMSGPTPILSNSNDRGKATRWKPVAGPLGTYSFKNVSVKGNVSWLDSYPSIASTSLATSVKDSPGTFFQIRLRNKFDPRIQGQWSAVESHPVSGIHIHVLPNGKVLLWSRFMDPTDVGSTIEGVATGKAATYIYDPRTGESEVVPNSDVDTFCSGHSFLPDGRLLVSGGHIRSNVGPKSTQIFDWRTKKWETSPSWDMNQGRWYPTNITLANGDIITVSGDATSAQDPNRIPQVWSHKTHQWRDLNGLASSCFNESNGPCMPLYPWLHQAPNGKVFVSGPGQDTGYIDTKGEGSWTLLAKTNKGYRGDYEATSIMYAPGKVMIAGGVPATNSVETIDLNVKDPVWTNAAPMGYRRHKLTSTLLADGQVFVSGGSASDGNSDDPTVFASEIWNPETGKWTEADHIAIPRLYHSTAVLLSDGRILSMGGGLGAGFNTHKNFQIYSPPYLFRGARPTLKAKDELSYGETFQIESKDALDISKVHMIKLSSDTHSFNSSQHIVPLTFAAESKGLKATVSLEPAYAPPGYYFLFVVNKAGVPSLAKTVKLHTQKDNVQSTEQTSNEVMTN